MYTLKEISDKKSERDFITLPIKLYKNNPYWIRPLDNDIKQIFNPVKNPYFKHGECTRWVLYDNSQCIGRIAAFINYQTSHIDDYTVGQMGFFECINNKDAAFLLFNTCRNWLENRGMEAMEGPVNFGERLHWWGVLTNGFDRCPNYAMPYTHSYYKDFFKSYGFKDYFQQLTYRTHLVMDNLSRIVVWKSERLLRNPDYQILSYGDIGHKKAVLSLFDIYNQTWNPQTHGVDGMTLEQIETLYRKLRPILDKELIYFAYFKNRPIGFFIMFPEINQLIKQMNGKMNFFGLLKFYYYLRTKKVDTALGQLFGIIPEFQGKGVEAAMITRFCEIIIERNSPYKYLEMNWIGDFNPQMIHLMQYIGAKRVKTHVTYRKLFRENIPFSRKADFQKNRTKNV